MVKLAGLLLWLALLPLTAAEVVVQAPDEVVPDAPFECQLQIIDPAKDIIGIDIPAASDGLALTKKPNSVNRRPMLYQGRQVLVVLVGLLGQTDRQEGTVTIQPIGVEFADGTSAASKPVEITVTRGDPRLTGDYHAEVVFIPDTVVPGQTVTMRYDLFIKDVRRVDLGESSIAPPAEASSVEELETEQSKVLGADGNRWHRVRFSWRCTFITPGTYQVGGQQQILQRGLIGARHLATVPVKSGSVEVDEFPLAGRPEGFNGLVGPLDLRMELDRDTLALGEGTILRLTVQGPELSLLARPDLPLREGYRVHPLEVEEVAGGRSFTWNIAPVQEGELTVPSIQLDYFDPASMTYRQASSGSLTFTVLPGRQAELEVGGRSRPLVEGLGGSAGSVLVLPEPLRGSGGAGLPPWIGPIALLAGLAGGLAVGLGLRQRARPRARHRGRELRAAMRREDWEAVDRLLHALQPSCRSESAADCRLAIAAVERHRFGGDALDERARAALDRLTEEA